MKLDPSSTIGGQPVKVVRDMLRGRDNISFESIVEHLQQDWRHEFIEDLFKRGVISREVRNYARREERLTGKTFYGERVPKMPDFRAPSRALFDYLLADGYIERADDKGHHTTTIKGAALGMTKFLPRIDRAKAEALLKGVLERVAAVNADPELMYWVTEVRLFGSYLTDANDLGDLDLALNYQRRPIGGGEGGFAAAIKAFAAKHDKQHLSWLDQLGLPERMVVQRIKGRSPYISMHRVDELDNNPEMGGKTVYTFTPTSSSSGTSELQATSNL